MTARYRPHRRFAAVALLLAATVGRSRPAAAWDPATTHMALTDRAAVDSRVHVHWFAGSDGAFGLFSPLRVDPARLSDEERRLLLRATRAAPRDVGASPMGGPGACPEPPAPPGTRDDCVEGDLWEASALTWLRLGVVAEAVPPERLLGHFSTPGDPKARTWRDPRLARTVARARHTRANGATLASLMTASSEGAGGPTALAHARARSNPLGLAPLSAYLVDAYTAKEAAHREHARAMALLCAGALLHIVQDGTFPAHARGDLAAFFSPLSDTPGDRGAPLAAYAARLYGRQGPPRPADLAPRTDADAPPLPPGVPPPPAAASLAALLFGDGTFPGAVPFTAGRFLSDGTLPPPKRLRATDPKSAARELLEGTGLAPKVMRGSRLDRWPAAPRGYLRTRTGRPLAAWERQEDGRIALWLPRSVLRDQMGHLLPLAEALSRTLLASIWPAPPTVRAAPGRIEVRLPGGAKARVVAFADDEHGTRTILAEGVLDDEGAAHLPVPRRPTGVVVLGHRGRLPFAAETRIPPEEGTRRPPQDEPPAPPSLPGPIPR